MFNVVGFLSAVLMIFSFASPEAIASEGKVKSPTNSDSSVLQQAFEFSPTLNQLDVLKPMEDRPAFREGTAHPDMFRLNAEYILGRAMVSEAIPFLRDILYENGSDEMHERLRIQAVNALNEIGTEQAREFISGASFNDKSGLVRKRASEIMAGERQWNSNRFASAARSAFQPDQTEFKSLGLSDSLKKIMEANSTWLQSITAEKLGQAKDEDKALAVGILKAALDLKLHPLTRFKIFQALWQLNTPESMALLRSLISAPTTSDQDKNYLAFFLNHSRASLKNGNTKVDFGKMASFLQISKNNEIVPESKAKLETSHTPQSSTQPNTSPTSPITNTIGRQPVVDADGRELYCAYLYDGKCFATPTDLMKYLFGKYKEKQPSANAPQAIDIISYDAHDKEVCKKGFQFDGKCFLSQDDLLGYLSKRIGGGQPSQPQPSQFPHSKEKSPDEDRYDDFDSTEKKIGDIHSKAGGYLQFARYGKVGQKGPFGITPLSATPVSRADFPETVRVCFDERELGNTLGLTSSITTTSADQLEKMLPTTEHHSVVRDSITRDKGTLCYEIAKTANHGHGDYETARSTSNRMLEGYKGIDALPREVQDELLTQWQSGKNPQEKVKALESYWQKKVEYLLHDGKLYGDYFSRNPQHNLIQAACELGKGRCVPKNFALGVAIHQLSQGTIPVRFSKAFWLPGRDTSPIAITTDALHLHTEYMLPPANAHEAKWRTAEASFSAATEDSNKDEDKAPVDPQGDPDNQMATKPGDIRAIVEKELAGRKAVKFPHNATQFQEITEEYDNIDGKKTLKKMTLEPLQQPNSEKSLITIHEKNGKVYLSGMSDKEQIIPDMAFIDLFAGKPEHLAIFSGLEPGMQNRMSLQRSWQALGGRRYRDVRRITISIPEARDVIIEDDYILDFATDGIVQKMVRSINGQKVLEVAP